MGSVCPQRVALGDADALNSGSLETGWLWWERAVKRFRSGKVVVGPQRPLAYGAVSQHACSSCSPRTNV